MKQETKKELSLVNEHLTRERNLSTMQQTHITKLVRDFKQVEKKLKTAEKKVFFNFVSAMGFVNVTNAKILLVNLY